MLRYVKYILLFLLFFAFFYLDSAFDFAIYSHLWKAALVIFISLFILLHKGIVPPTFIKIRILWSVQQIANIGSFVGDLFFNGLMMIRWLMLPIMYLFFERKYIYEPDKLYRVLITVTQFFALTNIPFMLGITEQTVHAAVISDLEGYTGIFGAVHTTAAVMATTTVILLYHLTHNKLNIAGYIYNIALTAISAYAVYMAFTRTGWIMLIVGILVAFIPAKFKLWNIAIFLAVAAGIYFTANTLYNDVESVRYRIDDVDPDTEYEMLRGSGRDLYREVSLNLWKSGTTTDKLFGVGLTRLMNNMKSVIGKRLFSHNGYVDALTANGVLGLFLMLLYILTLFIFLIKHRRSPYSRMGFAILTQYIFYQATQGHNIFATDLLYALILSLIITDSRNLAAADNEEPYTDMQ